MQGIQFEERAENRTMVTGYQPSDAQSSPRLAKLVLLRNTDTKVKRVTNSRGFHLPFCNRTLTHSLAVGSYNTVCKTTIDWGGRGSGPATETLHVPGGGGKMEG